jgi:hypothetical protein
VPDPAASSAEFDAKGEVEILQAIPAHAYRQQARSSSQCAILRSPMSCGRECSCGYETLGMNVRQVAVARPETPRSAAVQQATIGHEV